jgi:hypothetical protein
MPRKLKLATEIADWLTRGPRYAHKRSHAERDGEILRYYHPCGHTSWEPYAPLAALLPKRWTWDQGGVSCTCPRCYREIRKLAKEQRREIIAIRNLTRVGPDWERA